MEQISVTSTLERIQELIDKNSGDTGRLEYILIMLEKDKKLYKSDKQYLVNNFGISIIESQKIENNVKKYN